eukprot:4966335-Pyramimonas_sp.AAC.1
MPLPSAQGPRQKSSRPWMRARSVTGARLTLGWLGGARSERSMVGCKGAPTALRNLEGAESRGHLLTCAMIDSEDQEPFVFCYRCGAYSSK